MRILFFLAACLCGMHLNSIAQSVGLVLSGGGVRGFAHIGVLKALEENGIPVDYITGTSAGALVGSSYVLGRTPGQIEKLFTHKEFIQYGKGIISEEDLYYFLSKDKDPSWFSIKFGIDSVIRAKLPRSVINSAPADFTLLESTAQASAKAGYNFDKLMIPFRCVASDIKSKKQIIYKEGDLGLAVRASMAFPLYLPPLTINDQILFDGGIYNNFPIDVMLHDFNPDIIIAVNAAGDPEIPSDDNVLSQVKNILVAIEDAKLLREQDILLVPDINDISVFAFESAQAAIDSGYSAAMKLMPEIKRRIERRVSSDELNLKREKFIQGQKTIEVDRIHVYGLRPSQKKYIQQILNPTNDCITIRELKRKFFRLAQDEQFLYIFPQLVYDSITGYYDLHLYAKREKDLLMNIGGNFSSKPINTAFLNLQYNLLGSQSLKLFANSYYGKLYNSALARMRMDVPGRLRFYAEPLFSRSQFDYFNSSSTFFEDIKPSYLILTETNSAFDIGIPVRNRGKLIASASYFINDYTYYQTESFSKLDTADRSKLIAFSPSIEYERSSLDKKQFASSGSFFSISGRMVTGKLNFYPGSLALSDSSSNSKRWFQTRMIYDNYFTSFGRWKFGFYGDLFLSSQPFFDTYQSTILSVPQFEPTPESSTLFMPQYRAHSFAGIGIKSVLQLFSNLQLRAEGYIYQPVQEIVSNPLGRARYGEALNKRYLIGTTAIVFHNPIGPASLQLSYYQGKEKPLSVMFNFGYILFNRRTLK